MCCLSQEPARSVRRRVIEQMAPDAADCPLFLRDWLCQSGAEGWMPALSCCATTTCPSRQEASSGRLAGEQHTREALLLPLEPGSAVIVFSSGPRSTARRFPAATPEPRPPSGSSPPMPPRSPAATRSASGSPPCCLSSPGNRPGRGRSRRLRRQAGRRHPRLRRRFRPGAHPEQVGTAIADIAAGPGEDQDSYLLTSVGLSPVQ